MKVTAFGILLLCAVLPPASIAQGNENGPNSPEVLVLIYNQAGAPQTEVEPATRHATEIFALASVRLNWLTCPTDERGEGTPCARQPGANQIAVRLIRRPAGRKVEFAPHTGGVAIRSSPAGGSGFVTIYYDRVEELADKMRMHRMRILAHSLAHEVGHILLPPGSHARSGIMRERLGPEDWHAAAMGRLLFTAEQAEKMKTGLLAREATASASVAAAQQP